MSIENVFTLLLAAKYDDCSQCQFGDGFACEYFEPAESVNHYDVCSLHGQSLHPLTFKLGGL